MTAIKRLANFATSANPSDELRQIIAPAVADCFGCILAGADAEVTQRAIRALSRTGNGSATVYGSDQKLAAPHAALANAVAGHAWDLDDWEEPGNTHPTVVLLPALLAAAHLSPTSGKELSNAYAIGAEIIMRLGEAVSLDHYARGFHSTATLGTIGAAGAVSRLLRLSPEQTSHALALSVSQATGLTLQFGSNAKPLQAGWAARNGLEAALMAAEGVSAQHHVLDHPRGFAGLLGDLNGARFERALASLGEPWALQQYGLILKLWPSCGYTHRLMTAALELRPHIIDQLEKVTAISATLPDFHFEILPFQNPITRSEALFSAPACIGQALVAGDLTLNDSEARFWESPEVARLIQLTTVTPEPALHPELNYDPDQPDCLRVELSGSEFLETRCAYPLGAPQNPMSNEQLANKFAQITGRDKDGFSELMNWPDAPDVENFFSEIAK
ncbi:MmgE/PrpD family protein [Roseibium sp. RKSG952]|uniref:MmgE/PrpD family protein n=1 Tax=Roseibium sp. RKSG952 TaxID=2529384 RepID=UPI0018AD219F